MIYEEDDDEQLVESYHLATYLGYAQQHLLRKAVQTDWKRFFHPRIDYRIKHNESDLRRYEAAHEAAGFGALRPMGTTRGRMFFTVPGLRKVIFHTSKDVVRLKQELARAGVQVEDAGIEPFTHAPAAGKTKVPDGGLTETLESFRQTPVAGLEDPSLPYADPEERSKDLEQRKWEYGVLEQLLEHLRQLSEPVLQRLAITAAETALGRELSDLRVGLETARAHSAFAEMAAPPRRTLEDVPQLDGDTGPQPGERGGQWPGGSPGRFPLSRGVFYSCSDIGARAGGFSARAAGMAANSVASRRGITPEQLRSRCSGLDFVNIYTKTDAFGHPREMFAFDAKFANEVLRELQANFAPQRLDLGPDPSLDFGRQSKPYPKLSRGPFEDDDELTPGPG
jgi:hypothetical protein